MTPEQTALAREWVALRGWRWMPGMRDDRGWRIVADTPTLGLLWCDGRGSIQRGKGRLDVPDITDAATIGCLVALTREITGARLTCSDPLPSACVVLDWPGGQEGYHFGATLAEALLRAAQAVRR